MTWSPLLRKHRRLATLDFWTALSKGLKAAKQRLPLTGKPLDTSLAKVPQGATPWNAIYHLLSKAQANPVLRKQCEARKGELGAASGCLHMWDVLAKPNGTKPKPLALDLVDDPS